MAPEAFDEGVPPSARADQYSLAVTVFEMLSGTVPVIGTYDQLKAIHASKTSLRLEARTRGLPASLYRAMTQALSHEPGERFASCTDFATALLQDVPEQARSENYQFLCPNCRRLVRAPKTFGGKNCRCPACRAALRLSKSSDALWRREEDPEAGTTADAEGVDASQPVDIAITPKWVYAAELREMKRTRQKRYLRWDRSLWLSGLTFLSALLCFLVCASDFSSGRADRLSDALSGDVHHISTLGSSWVCTFSGWAAAGSALTFVVILLLHPRHGNGRTNLKGCLFAFGCLFVLAALGAVLEMLSAGAGRAP
jgi:hypothetical protein